MRLQIEHEKKVNIVSNKLYVGNLAQDGRMMVTASDLRPLFEEYGTVTDCEIVKNFAFVHMGDDEQATRGKYIFEIDNFCF